MSELVIRRQKVGPLRYREFIVSKDREQWRVEEWKAGKAVLQLSDGIFSLGFKGQALPPITAKDSKDLLLVFQAADRWKELGQPTKPRMDYR